jgi:hypothetical protein
MEESIRNDGRARLTGYIIHTVNTLFMFAQQNGFFFSLSLYTVIKTFTLSLPYRPGRLFHFPSICTFLKNFPGKRPNEWQSSVCVCISSIAMQCSMNKLHSEQCNPPIWKRRKQNNYVASTLIIYTDEKTNCCFFSENLLNFKLH